ncbi:DNA topoisomerase IA [Clostridium beijerinckii]|nr:DNA topoisomerase IA [Clostridium beijerinckii]
MKITRFLHIKNRFKICYNGYSSNNSDRLRAVSFGNYSTVTKELLSKKITGNKSFVDNSKVTDHHAIIPTEERANLMHFSSDERRVYELVIKRFLSVLLPPYEYIQTTIEAEISDEKLIAKGSYEISKGFKKLYQDNNEEKSGDEIKEQSLPKVNKDDTFTVKDVDLKRGETKPPARFNEGTLLSAMENPQKFISVGKEAAKTLNETGGLGTVATRADIIEKLFNSFVIEMKGKDIYPTSKGKQLIELVPKELKSPLLTAKWKVNLRK